MNLNFVLSIRFLTPLFHGRKDGGEPEWPPSPMRLFQALVAASTRTGALSAQSSAAFEWLEHQSTISPPIIIAPARVTPTPPGYCLSVPNNAMDIVAAAWSRGNDSNSGDANPATHRTMKTVRPTHILENDSVHYLWKPQTPLSDEDRGHADVLIQAARNISSFGWGIDLVIGNGLLLYDAEIEDLPGERWFPSSRSTSDGLRVPAIGTLKNLIVRHQGFLARLGKNGFVPPPLLTAYSKIEYLRPIDPPQRHVAAFALLKSDASGFRAFDTTRWGLSISGMARNAAKRTAQAANWTESKINTLISGHGELMVEKEHRSVGSRRFAYIPLPSIESRGNNKVPVVGQVRRILITAFDNTCDDDIAWAHRTLSGQELIKKQTSEEKEQESESIALLSLLPSSEKIVRLYIASSVTWATVTPVVLPGFDDPAHYRRRLKSTTCSEEQKRLLNHLNERIDALIRKAIVQAGFSPILADNAEIEWRKVGYWRGVDLADRYGIPDHLKRFPRYHVKLTWRDNKQKPVEIPGPICVGGGRFYGLGLFAPLNAR